MFGYVCTWFCFSYMVVMCIVVVKDCIAIVVQLHVLAYSIQYCAGTRNSRDLLF